ncbi:MAG: class I SAM-dependent methyltransferase [Bacteroidetes bacterium]|nr:class I SAM-dependent methyltransferase [Bacteroidota bacterium]
MLSKIKRLFGLNKKPNPSPERFFSDAFYQRHNHARQNHLASLGLGLARKTVLEVGAGIGDHSVFFLSRNCNLTATDARQENLEVLKKKFPSVNTIPLDLDNPQPINSTFDVVYCYGLLYHLQNPENAIKFMAENCTGLLLLETCVSYGDDDKLNPIDEDGNNPTQSFSGKGCRPSRRWVYNRLKENFPFVYLPLTQPQHEEFPTNWETQPTNGTLFRSVFIASKEKLNNPKLTEELVMEHNG